ncbi:MAG: hypothetical protein COV74_00155 [Candidatus Omnitrophica bacterium CG11_big_fil_rev_8_21_14_0_20_45_26]|uniref:VWA-like domain-containing protein n=1 Tax=Candidatus Abzuiibacterium crystallinum TaxID=1974748 RepID=A0A2H0LSY9_9BACT|nr:MAG: hypothetical protein COV74_00155 [Candidatus Omnitrophica bacterium CG11_big_fil_rev_8_21_14_0_20_45_26]PIW64795.1 MAG: hypothetical protein COW12_04650 [Candidatus Omnitrophica bacterium CG12_big_fil_rev_8_21_14_0_65_45_16]
MIEKMIVSLIKTKPFYAHFLQQMNRIETEKIATLGVNITKRINLFFNPSFLKRLNTRERVACLEHEVLHLLNLHLFRGEDKEKRIFNVACDLAINPFIENLPDGVLMPKTFGFDEGQTAEWYYKKLIRNFDFDALNVKDGLAPLDDHAIWSETTEGAEYRKEFLKRAVKLSLAETKDYGSLPGDLQDELKSFLEDSKVNWRRLLERFITHATITKFIVSRKRPNRRFDDLPCERVDLKLKLLVGLDTSGSVGDEELALFFSEIEKIKALGMEITVAECDAQVGNVYPYRHRPKAVSGRGGTDFRPLFEFAAKKRPDAIVYLTDGFGDYPEKSPIPTLWCLTPDGDFSGSFGKVVKLPAARHPN